tara:strand:- start:504 stop:713 length:210 start_codon:yes stop_codon:yes gene_type:complete
MKKKAILILGGQVYVCHPHLGAGQQDWRTLKPLHCQANTDNALFIKAPGLHQRLNQGASTSLILQTRTP